MSPRKLQELRRLRQELKSAGDLNHLQRAAGLENFRRTLIDLCGEEPAILMTVESPARCADDLAQVPLSDYFSWLLKTGHAGIFAKAEAGGFRCLAAFGEVPAYLSPDAFLPKWLLTHGPLVRSRLTLAGLSADESERLLAELDALQAHLVVPIILNDRLWGFIMAGPSLAGEYRGGETLYLGLYGLSLISSLERRRQGLPPRAVTQAQRETQALREAQQLWMSLRPRHFRLKLLVVDEEPQTLASLSRFFEGWGIDVTGARSEEAALILTRQLHPHLFLIDTSRQRHPSPRLLKALRILVPEAAVQLFRKPCRFSRLALGIFEAALGVAVNRRGIPYPKLESCLIIDQEKEAAGALKEYFEARGSRVWVAESKEAARSIVERVKPYLILLDQKMPVEGGLNLIHWIRSTSPESRVIVLTNSLEESPMKASRKISAPDAYVLKPVPISEIDRLVEDLLLAPAPAHAPAHALAPAHA